MTPFVTTLRPWGALLVDPTATSVTATESLWCTSGALSGASIGESGGASVDALANEEEVYGHHFDILEFQ